MSAHLAESVDAIVAFHREHYRSASVLQRSADWLTDRLGRPTFAAIVLIALTVWIMATVTMSNGRTDDPAFAWLELAGTLCALVVALLILVTQRRQDQLSDRRARLTLELAMLAERKTAKLIALIEELRRDHPDIVDRVDLESTEMAKPADAKTVLAAIDVEETQRGIRQ